MFFLTFLSFFLLRPPGSRILLFLLQCLTSQQLYLDLGTFRLEGTSGGGLVQLLTQSMANFKHRLGCSGPCAAEFWKSPRTEILPSLWASAPCAEQTNVPPHTALSGQSPPSAGTQGLKVPAQEIPVFFHVIIMFIFKWLQT